MGVYVDDLQPVIKLGLFPSRESCHLVADTLGELHNFAGRLNLKRIWFQPRSHPHYDLTGNKRRQALRFGALEITDRRLVEIIREHRQAPKGE